MPVYEVRMTDVDCAIHQSVISCRETLRKNEKLVAALSVKCCWDQCS